MDANLVPFADLLSVVIDNRGRTCPVADSGIPLIATNCLRNDFLYPSYDKVRYVSQETYDNTLRGQTLPGDLIFVTKGTPGRVCMAPDPVDFCIAQDMVAVRADQRKIYPKYLFALLRSAAVQNQIEQMHVGTLIPHFKKGDFDKLLLPVPDPRTQRVIGDLYFDFSAKIESNRRMNQTLEAMARAIFKSWFVDFDPARAKADGRQPFGMDAETASLFPNSFQDSEFGKIPRGFQVTELGSVLAELETGSRPKGGVGGYAEGVPSIGAESIVGLAKFDFTKTKYVPYDYYLQMTKGKVKSRDVLLYKDGGKPGVYEPHVTLFGDGFPFDQACINEHVYRIRGQRPLSQVYLYFWMTSELATDEMRQKGTGVAIPGLNSTSVRSLNILVPPEGVLRRYEETCEPMIRSILNNANESCTLAVTRDTLLPKLVSGEIRVKASE